MCIRGASRVTEMLRRVCNKPPDEVEICRRCAPDGGLESRVSRGCCGSLGTWAPGWTSEIRICFSWLRPAWFNGACCGGRRQCGYEIVLLITAQERSEPGGVGDPAGNVARDRVLDRGHHSWKAPSSRARKAHPDRVRCHSEKPCRTRGIGNRVTPTLSGPTRCWS